MISSEKSHRNSQPKAISSLSNIKSAVVLQNRNMAQESQEHLDAMNRIVDQTDENLRQALEHAVVRHEQLDDLHHRSEEMLQKNENLVFGKEKKKEEDLHYLTSVVLTSFRRQKRFLPDDDRNCPC